MEKKIKKEIKRKVKKEIKKKVKGLLIEIIFWLHLPIVVLWFGLFLVPRSVWAGRVSFHFWFIAGIMAGQFVWSVLMFRRLDIICPLTTLMQWLKGYKLGDKKNYGHSYIGELLGRLGLRTSYKWVNIILVATLVLITVEYFWGRF